MAATPQGQRIDTPANRKGYSRKPRTFTAGTQRKLSTQTLLD